MDVVVSYDCLPKIGGAHSWLYEVYRRWDSPVVFLTTNPSTNPAEAQAERAFDAQDHGPLKIARVVEQPGDISLLKPACLATFFAHVRSVGSFASGGRTQLHALRAFPEGITAALYRATHPFSSRLITYAHGEEILVAQMSRQLSMLARWVYERSDLVIVNSENTRKLVQALCPSARTECVHPGVEVAGYEQSEQSIAQQRAAWGWAPDSVIVGTVARMEPRKNQATIIRALARLREAGAPLCYVCGGDGECRADLADLVQSLGVGQWVRFTGRVSEAEKRLTFAAIDIHAMPSIRVGPLTEGFGIVFLEAAAAGRPSICGSAGGQAEAVIDGKTGLVVDGLDEAAVEGALRRLAGDAALRASMGQNGRAWARENDWSRITKRTQDLARSL